MLLRAILAAKKPTLTGRLGGILEGLDVGVEGCASVDEIWSQVARESTDLIFASRELLEGNPADLVRSSRGLPESIRARSEEHTS